MSARRSAALLLLAATTGCAGATVGSGVGDRVLEHPPYYAGAGAAVRGAPLRHVPIAYQRGASQDRMFDPSDSAGTPIAALLREMNAYLDGLRVSTPLDASARQVGTPPDVRFGCETDATGDCAGFDETEPAGDPRYHLAVGRPSAAWTSWLAGATAADSALTLVITLEIGQYFPRQVNIAGAKAVELGTDHEVRLPWLTSLETPVSVIQLTGALVGPDGRARRIGAEGMLARRTGLVQSGFGMQALIRDEDVERLRTARRSDLAGDPLVWQAALRSLVAGLTGQPPAR